MSLQDDVEALRRIPLFAKIEPAKLKLMAFASERALYRPGDFLFRQGDIADSAYIILDGEVEVLVTTPTGPVKVADLGKGAFLGEIGILCDVPRTATIRAAGDLSTLRITKDLFFRMVTDFPAIGIEVMRELATRLERMNARLSAALADR